MICFRQSSYSRSDVLQESRVAGRLCCSPVPAIKSPRQDWVRGGARHSEAPRAKQTGPGNPDEAPFSPRPPSAPSPCTKAFTVDSIRTEHLPAAYLIAITYATAASPQFSPALNAALRSFVKIDSSNSPFAPATTCPAAVSMGHILPALYLCHPCLLAMCGGPAFEDFRLLLGALASCPTSTQGTSGRYHPSSKTPKETSHSGDKRSREAKIKSTASGRKRAYLAYHENRS